ncbi:MAG: insulinase family protein [Planctomyces sp.]|nr:insulinase family protein [Planctomyces sp.]
MTFQQHQLSNGLQVIAEINPSACSSALGFFVNTGACDETCEVGGVSHFLEHMAFKGNDRFTADDVNRVFDELGAQYNASTSEEVTLYYAAILPEYLPGTFELLANLLRPALRTEDFETEKQVILEEIGMYDDMPAFLVLEKAMEVHFEGHPLCQSVLGSIDTVSRLTVDQMRGYFAERYRAGNITLAAAGNVDWNELLELAEAHCGNWPQGSPERLRCDCPPAGKTVLFARPLNQQHLVTMGAAPSATDRLRFAAELVSVIVGDDTGSRLYWELVDPGHAESADLSYNDYQGAGLWSTYLCSTPDQAARNLARIREVYAEVNRDGVTPDELEQARTKVASRVVLQSERPMGRLASLGGNWLHRQEYRTIEDDLRDLDGVTLADIRELLEAYPLTKVTTVGVGPLESI